MAATAQTRQTKTTLAVTREKKMASAMGKAIRELKRAADIERFPLVVADRKPWSVPK